MRYCLLAAFAALVLTACASRQSVESNTQEAARIAAGSSVYVTVPENGRYGQAVYKRSGQMTAQRISAAFAKNVQRSQIGETFDTEAAALSAAGKAGADYLVQPRILHWEDRATEWSGLPDRVEVLISVFETKTGALIDKATITGKSSWWTLGGDHPQDLLGKPVNEYVNRLAGS